MSFIHLEGRTQCKLIYAASFLVPIYTSLQSAQKFSKAFLQLSGKHQGAAQMQKPQQLPQKNSRNKHRNFSLKTDVKKTMEWKF